MGNLCPQCSGSGTLLKNSAEEGDCYQCKGMGKVTTRDPAFEQHELETVVELCQRAHGVSATPFVRAVQERLDAGEQEYGNQYRLGTRDNLQEALEEPPDVAGYLLLELQRLKPLMRDDDWQELRMLAIDAEAFAAATYERLLRLRLARDELKQWIGKAVNV